MSPVAQVELAIVQLLRDAQRNYTGLTIESYAAQLDDELFGWVRTLPAVWVTFSGIPSSKRVGANSYLNSATFEVLSAQRALQENAARLNDESAGNDVGVYTLIEDNKLLLVNQKLGLAIQPIQPGAIRAVMKTQINRDGVVVYAQEFHTEWIETFEDPAATLLPNEAGDLATVAFSYWLKPEHNTLTDQPDRTDSLSPQ